MSTPATHAAARRLFRLPSLREHWLDLRRRPSAWLAIGRNLVPVFGVFALGWSRSLVVFDFWFDGLMGLVAILTAITPRAVRESAKPDDNAAKRVAMGVVAWVFLVAFLCLPYWIVLIPLHDFILDPEMWRQVRVSHGLQLTFAGIALTQLVTAFRKPYGTLPEQQMKQLLRSDAYLLILKAIGMFVLGANLPMVLMVPALALFGTYLELWPRNALGAVWGDPSRLYEDPAGSPAAETKLHREASSPAPRPAKKRRHRR